MELDRTACYRALRARDARFDGRFFTAVRSTGVYCRPICPARLPKLENCRFLPSAAAAQELGYRPCLRCRPEASPGTPAWLGTSATVSRALRLIAEGALDAGSVDQLATRLGVGERHLRRLFVRHLGASPASVANTRRVLFAVKLIGETRLPFAEIAFASGFTSVRRFNGAIRATCARTPRELRRGGAARSGATPADLVLRLPFRPPLEWRALLRYLALRATPGVEVVAGNAYRRSVVVDGARGWLDVCPAEGENHLLAQIHVPGQVALIGVAERLRRIFDLGADPAEIDAQLGSDPVLRSSVRRHPGLRVPGCWDGFELCVRAILGQQVTVSGATTLAGRLVSSFGEKLESDAGAPAELGFCFPTPEALADVDLSGIGLPQARADTISGLARAVADGELSFDASRGLEAAVARMSELPGIGDWTAQYVSLRALREPDAFPAGDLGLRRAATHEGVMPSARQLAERAEGWRPWRGYAAMHLWNSPPPTRQEKTP